METSHFVRCVFCTFLLSAIFIAVDACDGYKLTLHKLKECGGSTSIIKVSGVNIILNKDCEVSIEGCASIIKQLKKCKVKYNVKKSSMMVPFKGEKDMCDEMRKAQSNPETIKKMKEKGLEPMNCPLDPVEACAPEDSKMDISQYKDKFRLISGKYSGTVTVECDSGKSCFEFEAEFKRGK